MRKTRTRPPTNVGDKLKAWEKVDKGSLNQEEQSLSSPSTKEELYRQSAPADMRHLPSDESIYRPSAPIIDPEYSTIEPESSMVIRGLIFGILFSLILIGIVFLVVELFRLIF